MTSAIELYQRAYDLDYRKGDWEYAEELYRQIIEKYPYSDEKEYALVHLDRLDKLKANPHNQELQPIRAKGGGGFLAFCFILILLLGAGTGFLGYLTWQQHLRSESNDLIIQGLISEKTNNQELAQTQYQLAKETYPQNSLAYHLLGELYLTQGDKDMAERESRHWELAKPHDIAIKEFRNRIDNYKEDKD